MLFYMRRGGLLLPHGVALVDVVNIHAKEQICLTRLISLHFPQHSSPRFPQHLISIFFYRTSSSSY